MIIESRSACAFPRLPKVLALVFATLLPKETESDAGEILSEKIDSRSPQHSILMVRKCEKVITFYDS